MINSDDSYDSIIKDYNIHVPTLKRVLKKSGFFTYFIMERHRIKNWNNYNELLEFKYLGVQLNLTREYKETLDVIFFNHLLKLSPYLNEIIKNGWKMKFITIYDYNILVNFKQFFDNYYQVAKSPELLKEDFFALERSYIKISYKEFYLDRIQSIFVKYLITNNDKYFKNQDKIDNLLENLASFLSLKTLPFTIKELILTYNMYKYRRFYRWGDLFPPLNDEIVQSRCYNCTREVFDSLLNYNKELVNSIDSLNKEKTRLLRLKGNCNVNQTETPLILVTFYESLNHDWDLDNSNYQLLFLLLFQGVIDHLDRFVFREWELMNDKEVIVHQFLIMDKELPQLFLKMKREHEMAFTYFNADTSPINTVQEFRDHKNPEMMIISEMQQKMFTSFEEILSSLFEISELLLAYGDVAIDSDYTINPFFKYMINAPDKWIGKPVFELFNHYVELCWTICAFFRHKTFRFMDSRLIEIDKTYSELLDEKSRIDAHNIIGSTIISKSSKSETAVE